MPAVGLINMNGRVYDPVLGRFLSPDPQLQTPGDLQNYNRYSYVLNNPLRYTDPTGYDFWGSLGNIFSNPGSAIMFFAETAMSVFACVVAPGVGCMVVGAMIAMFNATVAISEGASFGQTALTLGIGLGVGALTSGIVAGLAGPDASSVWGIVGGGASAAATSALSDVVAGQSVGWDVFWSTAISAARGGITFGLRQVVPVSQASAQPQAGSGEAQAERSVGANPSGVSDRMPPGAGGGDSGGGRGVGVALGYAGRFTLDLIGKVWGLPNTALGLAVAVVEEIVSVLSLPFGGHVIQISFANNALQVINAPIAVPGNAFTLGNVQFYPVGKSPDDIGVYDSPTAPLGVHEEAHTFQSQLFGPMFLLIWAANGGPTISNPLEASANSYALGGSWLQGGK
jgi:RHS repeat-associated protein